MASITLENRTLSAVLLAEMREAILDGRYPPGALLRQESLAKEYDVSRVPVRQALLELATEGLVRLEPRRGATVTGITQAEIDDVFGLRLTLEPLLLAAAMPHMGARNFDALDLLQDQYARAIEANESALYADLNRRFHLCLYASADRPKSLDVLDLLLKASNRYTRVFLSVREDLYAARDEHSELIAYCRGHEIEAARACLERHLRGVWRSVEGFPVLAQEPPVR